MLIVIKINHKRKHHKTQIQNTGKVGRVLKNINLVEETELVLTQWRQTNPRGWGVK